MKAVGTPKEKHLIHANLPKMRKRQNAMGQVRSWLLAINGGTPRVLSNRTFQHLSRYTMTSGDILHNSLAAALATYEIVLRLTGTNKYYSNEVVLS
jgi:hypothetical protein